MAVVSLGAPHASPAPVFTYEGWRREGSRVSFDFDLGSRRASEVWEFDNRVDWSRPGLERILDLLAALVGLSYYKLDVADRVELGPLRLTPAGRELLRGALVNGLGEFAFRNNLDLTGVEISGPSVAPEGVPPESSSDAVLVPFGGGIDSVVTVEGVRRYHPTTLFIVSPSQGRFEPLEDTARVSGLDIARATRHLDTEILLGPGYRGHVPVTAIITLASALVAWGGGFAAVAMSNEHSASIPNVVVEGRPVNHQWSKSLEAEVAISRALAEVVGPSLLVASALRDRSEIWVAERFSRLEQYHAHFRSCNRAFTHDPARRAAQWCGECDKCLFIDLVLAPFIERLRLRETLGVEPVSSPTQRQALRTLVGLGDERKPFECVGDPDECALALQILARDTTWADVPALAEIAADLPLAHLDDHLRSRGVTYAPRTWLL